LKKGGTFVGHLLRSIFFPVETLKLLEWIFNGAPSSDVSALMGEALYLERTAY
jgi:hypothetical protein